MDAWFAVLDAPDMQRCRSAELDLRPLQIADFRGPQAVPEANQHQRGVAVTPAAVLCRLDQFLYLGRRQILAGA